MTKLDVVRVWVLNCANNDIVIEINFDANLMNAMWKFILDSSFLLDLHESEREF